MTTSSQAPATNAATAPMFVFPSRALPRNELPAEGIIPVYYQSELRLGDICCLNSALVRQEHLDTPQVKMWRCPSSGHYIGTYSDFPGLNQMFGCHPTLGMPMPMAIHPLAANKGVRNAIPEVSGPHKP